MKALRYRGERDIRCETISDPALKDQSGVIVKMKACGICGSDLHIYHGQGFSKDDGYCVGHEAIGEIVETGRDVKSFKSGDEVMLAASVRSGDCGVCAACVGGMPVKCAKQIWGCYGLSHALEGCQAEAIAVPRPTTI